MFTPFIALLGFHGSPLTPTHLRCAHLTNPLGIDDRQPSLSWVLETRDPSLRDQRQSAYQVQVASSQNFLKPNIWDSHKIASSNSVAVKYAGRALKSNEQCFWRIRAWDQDGKPTGWSKPALWTMGVLSPREWKAKLIDAAVREARWKDFTVETTFTIQREAAAIYFRASGPGKAYMWQISVVGNEPTFRPHSRINGFYEVLKSVSLGKEYTKADFQKPHNLRITARGKTITTYLDGHLIDTMTDDKLDTGSIGFRGSPTETATFRDVKVTDLAGKTLYQNDFPSAHPTSFSTGDLGPDGLTVSGTDAMLESGNLRTPMLRREFKIQKPVKRAWLYASALGIYAANINGKRVGDRYYAPGWTNYYRRVQYQSYDVTKQIQAGNNAIGVQLAPGWFCGKIAWFGPDQYGSDCPKFFGELHIQYKDGSEKVIPTDQTWRTSTGPVLVADNLDGETYDARKEQPGWDQPNFKDEAWQPAHVSNLARPLVSQLEPPIRATQVLPAKEVAQPRPKTYLFKLPQEITGVARIRMRGEPGITVTIRQAELLNADGTLNTITLESPGIPGAHAEATDRYTFGKSGEVIFQPEFTFHGFQYIEVSGDIEKPFVEGVVYGTDVPHTGQLQTSNELINRLQSALQWSGRDAYMSAPMDCPQRTERLGWTGDANFYLTTAVFNFDMSGFYRKWENDMLTDGQFSNAAPGWYPEDAKGTGGGWGDAGVNVPYVLWQTYGDTQIIKDSYASMVRWIEFLKSQSPGLITKGEISAPADWKNAGEGTDQDFIATAYFAYDTWQLSKMAATIGRTADAQKYAGLFEQIRQAFIGKFVKANGFIGTGSQTSYVMALKIGLLPENLLTKAAENLTANITAHQNHLTTGFVGTQWLLEVLTELDRGDLAYALLTQTTRPSWGYMLSHKTTTIWETWDVIAPDGSFPHGPYSLNHCALGSCGDWMYQNLGGISPDPNQPGYKHFFARPNITTVDSASAHFESVYGTIRTNWHVLPSAFEMDITVPVNTSATVYIPAATRKDVEGSEGLRFRGMMAKDAKMGPKFAGLSSFAGTGRDVRTPDADGDVRAPGSACWAVFELGSGQYHFRSNISK